MCAYGRARRAFYETDGARRLGGRPVPAPATAPPSSGNAWALARGGALTGDYEPKVYLRKLKRFLLSHGYY